MTNQKNLGKTQEKCLFGHTTKQLLSNFEGWGLTLVAYKKVL